MILIQLRRVTSAWVDSGLLSFSLESQLVHTALKGMTGIVLLHLNASAGTSYLHDNLVQLQMYLISALLTWLKREQPKATVSFMFFAWIPDLSNPKSSLELISCHDARFWVVTTTHMLSTYHSLYENDEIDLLLLIKRLDFDTRNYG